MTDNPDRPTPPSGPASGPASGPPPAPRPVPRPVPRLGPRPAPPRGGRPAEAAEPGTSPARGQVGEPPHPQPAPSDPAEWGRVDDEGNVYCRTEDGERHVGQAPDMGPEDALAFYGRKYDDLRLKVVLVRHRLDTGHVAPDEAAKTSRLLRDEIAEARVVGDLDTLRTELGDLDEAVARERERRKARRAEELVEARGQKNQIIEEAERLSTGTDWRHGADRLRSLLERWKALPRLDRATDDELWHRFSTARTTYTRRRKVHFAEQAEKRESAKTVKLTLIKEAEALSGSTDWGPTSGAYRELMRRWKAAGPAPRDVDDDLWQRFRAAQDVFFTARDEATKATDAEFAANAEVKEKLLAEAEALLPVTDLSEAKAAFRRIADRWDATGKVPRDRVRDLEGRMRKVEQAIRTVEEAAWKRSNPEARARAADTVAQLESSIADLQRKADDAAAAGDDRAAQQHTSALEARGEWLEQARKALEEFSG